MQKKIWNQYFPFPLLLSYISPRRCYCFSLFCCWIFLPLLTTANAEYQIGHLLTIISADGSRHASEVHVGTTKAIEPGHKIKKTFRLPADCSLLLRWLGLGDYTQSEPEKKNSCWD